MSWRGADLAHGSQGRRGCGDTGSCQAGRLSLRPQQPRPLPNPLWTQRFACRTSTNGPELLGVPALSQGPSSAPSATVEGVARRDPLKDLHLSAWLPPLMAGVRIRCPGDPGGCHAAGPAAALGSATQVMVGTAGQGQPGDMAAGDRAYFTSLSRERGSGENPFCYL